MTKVVLALEWWEVIKERTDARPQAFSGSFAGFAQEAFELGKRRFDRIEVATIGRHENQGCPACLDQCSGFCACVAQEIVEDSDTAKPQLGHK